MGLGYDLPAYPGDRAVVQPVSDPGRVQRKVVAWELHPTDDADHAAQVVKRAALAEAIAGQSIKPVLHGDNGATLEATKVLCMPNWLGIKPSSSRPRVAGFHSAVDSQEMPGWCGQKKNTVSAQHDSFIHLCVPRTEVLPVVFSDQIACFF